MREVTVREFSHNPSAFFALAEKGNSVTVTKRGRPIAILLPASDRLGKYTELVKSGQLQLASFTTDDIDRRPLHQTDQPDSPIQTILDMRDADAERETEMLRMLTGDED
ncbi:type II toxin-antitoxin system Phd/YefM family antitoxin [Glycomyces buryatensis]|uniref:Antitoxin n=1 Tax=Glycomyces buryatensis TaxID=2570927 RepID=A0A4S8QQA8_9ACTN|nr:type II toxin-antitoxin system Phd/YefM family antitoxin [Glycomyces buryatensis]THV42904.1 type II toxin-antitoxin system Phd/YefM family antitoxin [Glycomyces buryatensis]